MTFFTCCKLFIRNAVKLFELGCDITSFEYQSSDLRTSIDALVDLLSEKNRVRYCRPEYAALQQLQQLQGRVQADSSERDKCKVTKAYTAEHHLRVVKNLKGCGVQRANMHFEHFDRLGFFD